MGVQQDLLRITNHTLRKKAIRDTSGLAYRKRFVKSFEKARKKSFIKASQESELEIFRAIKKSNKRIFTLLRKTAFTRTIFNFHTCKLLRLNKAQLEDCVTVRLLQDSKLATRKSSKGIYEGTNRAQPFKYYKKYILHLQSTK